VSKLIIKTFPIEDIFHLPRVVPVVLVVPTPYVADVAAVLYIIAVAKSCVIPGINVVVGCPAEAGIYDNTGFPTVSASPLLLVALLLLDSLL
jgi:hypothetical protein